MYCKTSAKGCISFSKLNLLLETEDISSSEVNGKWTSYRNISGFSENTPHIFNDLTESQAEMKLLSLNCL